MLRALLIRRPYIDKILDGKKTWEIRGAKTNIRGTIALIASGSGTVIGVCELVDSVGPLTANSFRKNAAKAGMRPSEATLGRYRQTYAWMLAKPRYLKKPLPYGHPSGAVIWVNLDRNVEQLVLNQLQDSTTLQQRAASDTVEPFAKVKVVSVKYDDLNPERYDEGIYIGMIVKRVENRMKVVFVYETGEVEIAWLTRHDGRASDRWIDKTWAAIVTVDEATPSQREAFQRCVSPDRLAQLLKSERR